MENITLPRINKINITNFRGIQDLSIPLNRLENLLVIGDNGTGKSSIVDAVEFFFRLEIAKLGGRQDISACECIPFANSGSPTSRVECGFDSIGMNIWVDYVPSGSGKGKTSRQEIPELGPVFDFAHNHNFVLHRAQLTHFIEAKPADRYSSISELIGLDILDKTIDAWKKERAERERIDSDAAKKYYDLSSGLSGFLGCQVKQVVDIVNSINMLLNEYRISPVSSIPDIEKVKSALSGTSADQPNLDLANQYRDFNNRIQQFNDDWRGFNNNYQPLYEAWQMYLEKAACLSDADFMDIIKESQELIQKKNMDSCPVCEQPIDRPGLLVRLEIRKNNLSELDNAGVVLETARKESLKLLMLCRSHWEFIENSLPAFQWDLPDGWSDFTVWLNTSETAFETYPLILDAIASWSQHPVFTWISGVLSALSNRAEDQIRLLTPDADERKKAELAYILGQIHEKAASWSSAKIAFDQAGKNRLFIDSLYSSLVEARKDGVSKIIASLEDDFIRLYEKLHPGEGHKAIKIILKPERNASADLMTETDGLIPMHPLGNYSEGHLDSLGLCIFLAFIKRFNQDFPLIILDDVLTSIDSGHRMKVAQLLARDFKDYQIIITTHDELWGNELAATMSKEKISIKKIRMNPWTKERGATFDEYIPPNWEHYRQLIDRGSKQDAVAGAGRNLEQFLLTMRRHLHLAIPASLDDKYTLGTLAPAFWKWVDDHPMERPDFPDLTQRLEILKDEFDSYWRFRNWSGAHYNQWGVAISAEEARIFISILEQMEGYFKCPACSSLVVYDTSHKLVHCPECQPIPQPRVVYEYKPDWNVQAQRMISNSAGIKNFETSLLKLSRLAFERMLRDARKRMQLLVPFKDDDGYAVPDLYPVLVQQLNSYPRSSVTDWHTRLADLDKKFRQFTTAELAWLDEGSTHPRLMEFYETVHSFTDLVSCPQCCSLLNLDGFAAAYYCSSCSPRPETTVSSPSFWFINTKAS